MGTAHAVTVIFIAAEVFIGMRSRIAHSTAEGHAFRMLYQAFRISK